MELVGIGTFNYCSIVLASCCACQPSKPKTTLRFKSEFARCCRMHGAEFARKDCQRRNLVCPKPGIFHPSLDGLDETEAFVSTPTCSISEACGCMFNGLLAAFSHRFNLRDIWGEARGFSLLSCSLWR